MPIMTIELDRPIKGWELMSAWEREMALNDAILQAVEQVLDTFEVVTISQDGNGGETIHSENAIAQVIILDANEGKITTRMK